MLQEALRVDSVIETELGLRVKIFLASQHFPGLRRVRVTTLGDTVILEGRLSSFHERQLAVACCQRVAGVRYVIDRLIVADGGDWDGKPIHVLPFKKHPLVAVEQAQFRGEKKSRDKEPIATLPSTMVSHPFPSTIAGGAIPSRPK